MVLAGLSVSTCKLDELVNPDPPGALVVDPALLRDSAAVGSRPVRQQTLAVTSSGPGALAWSAAKATASSWLALAPSSGTTPATLAVSFNPSALFVGEYQDTVIISQQNGAAEPLRVPVRFAVLPCREQPIGTGVTVADSLTASDCESLHQAGRFGKLFKFTATAGDSVSVTVRATGFGAYVLLDTATVGSAPALAESSSCPSGGAGACLRYVTLPRGGQYYLEVTSTAASAEGTFALDLSRPRLPDSPTSLAQFRADSLSPIAVGGGITDSVIVVRAVMGDPDPDDALQLQVELQPLGTDFTGQPTAASAPVSVGGQAAARVGGLRDNTSYHWRGRSVDQTGRASAWVAFGANGEDVADVVVTVPEPPATPTGLSQRRSDAATGIALGGTTDERTVVFAGTVRDNNPGELIRLEVEVRPVGAAFTGVASGTGVGVASGSTGLATLTGLGDDANYHWQARAVDPTGRASAWVPFGGNSESATDFAIAVPEPPGSPAALAQLRGDGITVLGVGDTVRQTVAVLRGGVTDPDPGAQIRLQVEVRPVAQGFANVPTDSSAAGSTGSTASVTVAGLGDDTNYHWQARATDETGRASAWSSFGGNGESSTDFRVQLPPTRLAFLVEPSAAAVDSAIIPAVQVQVHKQAGGPDSSFTGTVTVGLAPGTGAAGATLGGSTTGAAVKGIATFAGLRIDRVGTAYRLITVSSGLAPDTSTAFDITAGAPNRLTISTQPSATVQSGVAFPQQPVVQVRDGAGNPVAQSGIVVTAAIATGAGTLGGTTTATTDISGVATFSSLRITGATGIRTLIFTATSLTAVTSTNVTVVPGLAAQLTITTQPSSSVQSGVLFPQQPAIQVRDGAGNAVSQSGIVVTAAIASGGGTLGGTVAATSDASGVATFTNLSISGTIGSRTLGFTASGLVSATSGAITVAAGLAAQLALTTQPSATVQSGVVFPQQPVAQVRDAAGNAVSQSGIVVAVTIASGGGTLGGTTTATTASNGRATFSTLSITGTAGTRTLAFAATGLAGATSNSINVTSGAASQLTVTTQPSASAQSGVPFPQQPTVQLRDASGNALSQSGVVVTAAIATGGGVLGGTASVTTGATGLAIFTDLAISGTVGTRTLSFSATGLTAATSNAVALTPGPAAALSITVQPSSNAQSGVAFSQQPIVQLRDASGNAVSEVGRAVTAALATGAGGALNGTVTVTTASGGQASFTDLAITGAAGGYTIRFRSTGLDSVTSNSVTLGAGTGSRLALATSPSATVSSGVAFPQQPVVQLQDASGNPVAQAGVAIVVTIQSGGGTLSGTATVSTDAAGTARYTDLALAGTVGIRRLIFATNGYQSVSSGDISVIAGPAAQLTMTTPPSATVQSGVVFPQQPVVQLRDASGNAVSQAGVNVTAAIATGGGTLGGTAVVATNASGVAAFTNLAISGTVGSRTLAFSAPGLTGVASGSISLTAGPASQLTLTTQPSATVPSGVAFPVQPSVQVRDGAGNPVGQAGVVVTAAIATGAGTLGGALTASTNASGLATFTNLSITGATGDRTLSFTATGLTSVTSNVVTVTAGTATQLTITTQPSATVQSGLAFPQQPVLQVRDGAGNPVSQAGVAVTATLATGAGTLGGALTATTNAGGVATFTNLSITGPTGDRTLGFAATGLTGVTSGTVTVAAGTAAQLTITTQPSATVQSGIAFPQQPALQVRDGAGNPVSQTGVVVSATIASGGGTLGGTLTASTNASGVATFTNLMLTGAVGDRTLSFSAAGLTSATSGTVTITAGVASQLTLTTQPSASVQSGVAFPAQPVVQIRDASGNVVSQASVVVTAAVASGGGTLGGTLTASTNASGMATFTNLVLTGAVGNRTLSFSATGLTSATSNTVTVTAGAASQLSITSQPSASVQSGVAFPVQPVVQLRDASGNAVSQASVVVAAALATGGGTLGGTLTASTNASGIAAFSNLVLTGTVGDRTLAFSATGLTSITSSTVTVTVGPATQLTITTQPSATVQSGVAFAQQPVVQLRDAGGNVVSQAGVTVTAVIATGGGTLGGTTAVGTNPSGVATFTNLAVSGTVGTRTLSFTASGVTTAVSNAINITAGPAAQLTLTVQPSASAQSGVPFPQQPVLQVRDAAGNPVSQAGISVTAAIATGGGTLGGTTTVGTNSSGVASFADLSVTGTAGPRTLSFSAVGLTGVTSSTVTVGAAAATQLVLTTQPSATVQSGVSFPQQPVVQLQDPSGNVVAVAGVSVTASIASGGGTLAGTTTATTGASGAAAFTGLSISGTVGGRTLAFAAAGLVPDTSNAISVAAGLAARLGITVQPSSSAQSGLPFAQQPVIQVTDASGNPVNDPGRAVTASLASGPGGASLGGALTVSTSAGGQASFTNLAITGPTDVYTLRFKAAALDSATSNSVTLGAGAGSKLALTTPPSATVQSGVAFPQQPVVQLQDASGNPVAQPGVTVIATILSGGGTLAGTTSANTDAGGAAHFAGLVVTGTVGVRRLIFAADGFQSVSTGDIAVTAGVASQLTLTTQPSSSAQSGVAFVQQPVLQVRDGAGNVVTQSGIVVTAAIASGGGTLSGTTSVATDVGGVAAFTNLAISGTIGSRTLAFSASGLTGVATGGIGVVAGPAAQLTLTTQPSAHGPERACLPAAAGAPAAGRGGQSGQPDGRSRDRNARDGCRDVGRDADGDDQCGRGGDVHQSQHHGGNG